MIDLVGSRTLGDLLDESVARYGDKEWLTFEARNGNVSTLTYRNFQRQVDQLASGLAAWGVERGDVVLLHMSNHPRFLVAWYALAVIGVVSVPVNVDNTVGEVNFILELTQAVMVIASSDHIGKYSELKPRHKCLKTIVSSSDVPGQADVLAWEVLCSGGSGHRPGSTVASDDVLQMLFTSGTTARPKAAELTHANVLHAGERVVKGLALQPDDRCFTALPFFHVNAQVMAILSSMTVGGSCVLLENFSARNYWSQIRRHKATCTSLVAMQVRTILAQPLGADDKNHQIRRFSFFINVTDLEKETFESRFDVRFINGYGLTETMGIVAFTPVFGDQRWPSVGLPTADRQVRLVDDAGLDVAAGEVGEIIVSGVPGRTVMRGYFKDPDATARTIRDGWLYTGDKAHTDAKGYLCFVDRRANLIKRSGENVSATEVEFAILEHPGVSEVAVLGIPDAIRDERIMAVVVLKIGTSADIAELKTFCASRLAAFKIPTDWKVVDSLPRTSIKGDVDKKAIRSNVVRQS